MRPTLHGSFREVLSLESSEYHYHGIAWAIVWDPNKAIDIGGGGVDQWRWSVREVALSRQRLIFSTRCD